MMLRAFTPRLSLPQKRFWHGQKKLGIVRQLRSFKRQLLEEMPLQKVIFFGSRAYGKPHKDSDVDLLIVSSSFRKSRWLKRSPPLYLKWNLE
jgi:predicted nucleotidyltransferase